MHISIFLILSVAMRKMGSSLIGNLKDLGGLSLLVVFTPLEELDIASPFPFSSIVIGMEIRVHLVNCFGALPGKVHWSISEGG